MDCSTFHRQFDFATAKIKGFTLATNKIKASLVGPRKERSRRVKGEKCAGNERILTVQYLLLHSK